MNSVTELLQATIQGVDAEKNLSILHEHADSGDPEAQAALAKLYLFTHHSNEKLAFKYSFAAAAQGNSIGQFLLGFVHDQGIGTAENVKEALKWYLMSKTRMGYIFAAHHYEQGYSAHTPDLKQALHYFRKAADMSLAEAARIEVDGINVQDSQTELLGFLNRHRNSLTTFIEKNISVTELLAAIRSDCDIPKHLTLLTQMANSGNPIAQTSLGFIYHQGWSGEVDYTKSTYFFAQAAKQGIREAQQQLGQAYLGGIGIEQNIPEALFWLHESQRSIAYVFIADLYEKGIAQQFMTFKDHSIDPAMYYYRLSASKDEPEGQYQFGIFLERYQQLHGFSESLVKEQIHNLSRAVEAGHGQACCVLGMLYRDGNNVLPADIDKAVKMLTIGVEMNEPSSCYALGKLYLQGQGVNKNEAQGIKLIRQAASVELPEALYALGICYESGIGVSKDIDQAIHYYEKAAELGLQEAQWRLIELPSGQDEPQEASSFSQRAGDVLKSMGEFFMDELKKNCKH